MQYLKIWIWPGLASIACLAALAIWFETGTVENDLRSRTMQALRAEHPWAQILISGRDLTVTGLAPDEDDQASALDLIRSVYGVRVASDASVLLPEESPYRFSAQKTESGITLRGFVPNESARAEIIATVTGTLPGIALNDQLKLARGAPVGLISLAGYGLSSFPRFTTGSVEIIDRTMRISGQALNPEDHEEALASLSAIPPSAGVLSSIDIKPAAVIGPYVWSADVDAGRVIFSGYVPNADVRQSIRERASGLWADLKVDDETRLAFGVPEGVDWLPAVEQALGVAAKLSRGKVSLTDGILSVSGEARDADAFRSIQSMLSGRFEGGVVVGTSDIGMAGMTGGQWSARLRDEALELSGSVPSEAVRDVILDTARLKFGTIAVRDSLQVVPMSSQDFEAAALTALQALSRLGSGEVRIEGQSVELDGTGYNEAALADAEGLLADGLPEGYSGTSSVSLDDMARDPLSTDACQTQLNRLVASNVVRFETAAAEIEDHSFGFLDRVAHVAQQCGGVRLEISGHTDSDGLESDNQILSERRAEAVRAFMIAAGVAANRLVAVGYGESRPLAENDTDEGKAANRRIEFQVLE